jgi:uncharacterized protein
MKGLFWNRQEARLRAGWRIALFIVASGVASTVLAGPGRRSLRGLLPVVYANVIEAVVLVLLVGLLLWLAAHWLDRRRFVDYGFHLSRAWWLDLGFGLTLGVLLMAGVYALELAMGWVTVTDALVRPEGQPFVAAILADVIVVVGIAGWEEMAFRGYPIKNLAEGLYGSRGLPEDHRCDVGDRDCGPHPLDALRVGPFLHRGCDDVERAQHRALRNPVRSRVRAHR